MKDPVQPPFFEMNTQQILNLVSQCESSLGNKSFIWAFLLNTMNIEHATQQQHIYFGLWFSQSKLSKAPSMFFHSNFIEKRISDLILIV